LIQAVPQRRHIKSDPQRHDCTLVVRIQISYNAITDEAGGNARSID